MAIFEIGKVFTKEGEETRLAFLMTVTKKLFPEEEYSPYEAIGLMQDLSYLLRKNPQKDQLLKL